MNKIKEYFASKRVSNSLLGTLTNPKWVKFKMDNPDLEDDDKKHFRIGSGLDCRLTNGAEFDNEFMVIDVSKPYGYMGKFIDYLPASLTPDSSFDLYKEAYDKAGYKMKIDKVVDSFWTSPSAVEYYNATRNTQGKSILAKDEYESILNCENKLIANPFTYKYFKNQDSNIELLHQLPIYFEYYNHECKALMDGVRIDHKNKTIEPFDLKTIGKSIYDFQYSFLDYGYYRQAAFYTKALEIWISTERLDLKDYTWLPFIFIVVESKLSSSFPAIIYETTAEDIKAGIEGGVRYNKKYPGINELIDALDYHTSSGQWELPKDIFLNNGRILLNSFDNPNKEV